MPKISICIPTFNGELYLEDSLNCIFNQSYTDFEIIIVDDKSTDGTYNIAKQFADQDQRVHFYQNKTNLGLVSNWNKCIEYAKGEWIKFLFQDDLLHPDCLEKMIENANPKNRIIFCQRDLIYDPNDANSVILAQRIIKFPYFKNIFPNGGYIEPKTFIKTALEYQDVNFLGEPTTTLIHRDIFEIYGLFSPLLAQLCDLEFWLRVGVNEGIFLLPENLASFRLHDSSTTSKNIERRTFIIDYLDRLALRYEIVYSKHFAPIRQLSKQINPTNNLKEELYSLLNQTEWFIVSTMKKSPDTSKLLLSEWNNFITKHPRIRYSTFFWLKKAYKWLDRNILWRI